MNRMGIYDYINVLDAAADATWMRNDAIANNIANATTPGYKRQEVQFESELKKAMNRTGETTMDGKVAAIRTNDARPILYKDYDQYSYRADGNNVDPEQENVSLAKNQIKYEGLMNSISAEFKNLQAVMK